MDLEGYDVFTNRSDKSKGILKNFGKKTKNVLKILKPATNPGWNVVMESHYDEDDPKCSIMNISDFLCIMKSF